MKRWLSFVLDSVAFSRFVTFLEQANDNHPHLLRVLTYHRVQEPNLQSALSPDLISAAPQAFDQQMGYLAANYHVVSAGELLDAYQKGTNLPPRSVMVTFDDAYCDFAEHAWPILKSYQLPVTLFVPTAFPDQPERSFWWDRLYQAVSTAAGQDQVDTPFGTLSLATGAKRLQAFKRLRGYVKTLPHVEAMRWVDHMCLQLGCPKPVHSVLGWDALRQLAQEGVTLGAHTRTHPLINRISPEEAEAEAVGSLHDLEREIGDALPIFSYPSGALNPGVVQVIRRAGFALAFSTGHGINDLRKADRFQLRRINVTRNASLAVIRARLLSWSVYFNRWRPLPEA